MFIESFSKLLTADCLRQPSQLFLSLPLEDKVHLGARGDVAEFNEMLSCKARGNQEGGRPKSKSFDKDIDLENLSQCLERTSFLFVKLCAWLV